MLDIKLIRENPGLVKAELVKVGLEETSLTEYSRPIRAAASSSSSWTNCARAALANQKS